MNNVYKRFESVGEFSAYLAKGITKPEFKYCESSTEVSNEIYWHGELRAGR